jgi:hypothetical protein
MEFFDIPFEPLTPRLLLPRNDRSPLNTNPFNQQKKAPNFCATRDNKLVFPDLPDHMTRKDRPFDPWSDLRVETFPTSFLLQRNQVRFAEIRVPR